MESNQIPVYQTCKRCGAQVEQSGKYADTNQAVLYARGSSNLDGLYYRICSHVEKKPAQLDKPCLYKICKTTGKLPEQGELDKDSHLNEFHK